MSKQLSKPVIRHAIALLLMAFCGSQAFAWDASLELNPRAEIIGSKSKNQATRGLLIGRSSIEHGRFRLAAEGFAEAELETTRARERRSQNAGALQEAYIDWNLGSFFLRIGRQPVRWSQSWTLPSLDLFTGRRWNRLFFDPAPEQLVHSDGILATITGADTTLDIFTNLWPAPSQLPEPFPDADKREYDPEAGLRFQRKFGAVDSSFVYRWADELSTFGLAINYATDCCVWKTEGGVTEDQNGFAMLGVDFFMGDFSILPQVTRFLDEIATSDRSEHIGYLPIRQVFGRNALDFQLYRNFDAFDTFANLMYSYDITDHFKVGFFAQKYEGRAGRLFGVYQMLTESGGVAGLRLEINHAL
ncbi:MAG: hypothetical protein NDI61_06655 [Bdellovibrionaceae bacterium]|nr:hypothetical protein [Pseudobdellovibrionaceae bacterium]